jgi:hypothetical protein
VSAGVAIRTPALRANLLSYPCIRDELRLFRNDRSVRPNTVFTRTADALVNRPPDEVFAFLLEPGNRALYDDGVESQELTSPEPHGLGSTGVTRMRFLGRHYERPWVVVQYDPPRKLVLESRARPFPTWVGFELTGRGDVTWLEFSVTGRPGGLSRLLEPVMARSAEERVVRALQRIARLVEAGGS